MWAASRLLDGEPVALKIQRSDRAGHSFEQRFRFEANALKHIHHQALVRYRSFGQVDGRHYIAMELVEGRTCEALLRSRAMLAWRHAAQVVVRVLGASPSSPPAWR